MKNSFLGSNKIKILMHFLAWAILLGLPVFFIKRLQVGKDFIWLHYTGTLISGLIFYSNYLVLIPRFFFGIRRYKYFLSVLALIAFFYFVSDISSELIIKYIPGSANIEETGKKPEEMEQKPEPLPGGRFISRPPFRQMHIFSYTFNSLFIVFFSLGLKVLERHSQVEKLQKELERDKLNSELALLKNQVSPHFFFNTLNNIYSLIGINAEDSQKAVLKLSKLMRYLLYESEQGNTKLSSEIDFLHNYIDLMKLRMSDKISLSVSFPEKYEDMNIPPLLFIPFIENAFKHGISYREKSFIEISMLAAKDSLTFRCVNSNVKKKEDTEGVHSGIGLENVNKRLDLLFPGKHDLKINRSDAVFEVLLYINFA
ncbi:MAG: histidine kinase [Bacteroidia bacterium]|nr:histidine kinase [Bacteroidia bacterium]